MPAAPAACAHLVLTAAAGRTAGCRVAAGLPGRARRRARPRPSLDAPSLSPRRPSTTGGAYVETV